MKFEAIENIEQLQEFMKENLLTKSEAAKVTGQSVAGFSQSTKLGYIKPIYESQGAGAAKVRLYLKSDLEQYAKTKKN